MTPIEGVEDISRRASHWYDPNVVDALREVHGLKPLEVANRPDVQEMMGRVRFYTDSEAEKAGYDKMTTILKISLKDGRVISGRADFGKGSPANPMSYDEVAEKFLGCAAFAEWPTSKANQVIDMVRKLEDVSDVRMLTALCSK